MEDDNKRHPSLPANYVTLVQLQERWLKEKERKEKEKEQEEELKRKLADQKHSVGRRSRPNSSKSTNSNRRVWNRRGKPVALVSGVEVAGDGDKNADEGGKCVTSKKKTKSRRKNPSLEVKKEVTEKDRVAHALPENVDKEDIGGRRNEESRGVEGGFRTNGNNLDQRVEVETRIRDLSVNARSGEANGEFRRTSTLHSRGNREFRGNGHRRVEVETKNSDLSVNAGTGEENGEFRRTGTFHSRDNREFRGNGYRRVEVETKISDLSVNTRTGEGNAEFRRTSTFHSRGNREFRGNGYRRVEVETKISDLSVNTRTGEGNGEFRRTSTFHSRGNLEFRGNGCKRVGRREVWKQRGSGMVWVKKGELFNGHAGTVHKPESSGSVSGKDLHILRLHVLFVF